LNLNKEIPNRVSSIPSLVRL